MGPRESSGELTKHGVSFEEALTVFSDPLARIFDDEDHSDEERREIIIGDSVKQRLLIVCFTRREQQSDFLAHGEQPKENGKTMKKIQLVRRLRPLLRRCVGNTASTIGRPSPTGLLSRWEEGQLRWCLIRT